MTHPTPAAPSPRAPHGRRARRAMLATLVVILVAVAGVYAGARWRPSVASVLGLKTAGAEPGAGQPAPPGAPRQLWTCGMHPQVIQDEPGDCPICHMKLTPLNMDSGNAAGAGTVHEEEGAPGDPGAGVAAGAVVIDPAIVQNMGVRTATVIEGPLKRSVRLVGYLDEAEPNVHDINLRVSGWIRRLYVDTEGQHVEPGDPLFDLYSPELQVALEELLTARRAGGSLPRETGDDRAAGQVAGALYDAAAKKLELLGLDPRQIEILAKLDQAPETITFTSPATGYVTRKPIVEGAAVTAGQTALRIVDYSTLWLDARIFEKDMPFVRVGQTALAEVASRPAVPGEEIRGEIIFIHPSVDPATRTAVVRMAIPNPSGSLKPGMYATVRVEAQVAGRAVLVPREAIIDTGESQVAFVARGGGTFQPRRIRMGLPADDGLVQVVEGLAPGEDVVTSGQFLIDSESRLREAIRKFLSTQEASAGAGASRRPEGQAATVVETNPTGITSEQQHKADAIVAEYLKLSSLLGAVQETNAPLDLSALIAAAHALHADVAGTRYEPMAMDVASAAEAMKPHPIDHQRELFGALGEKVIALVGAVPPSSSVAATLYVMHCPMAPGKERGARGDWLQTSPDIANPFFATEMKTCGSRVRTITTTGKPAP